MENRYEEYRLVLTHEMIEPDGIHYRLEQPISVVVHLDAATPCRANVENEVFEKMMWEMRRYWENNKGRGDCKIPY